MQIFTHTNVSAECDGCKKAFPVSVPLGAKIRDLCARVERHHRLESPRCPRDKAAITEKRSYLDEFARHQATLHFSMIWRDVDELDLTKEERKTPMIIIG